MADDSDMAAEMMFQDTSSSSWSRHPPGTNSSSDPSMQTLDHSFIPDQPLHISHQYPYTPEEPPPSSFSVPQASTTFDQVYWNSSCEQEVQDDYNQQATYPSFNRYDDGQQQLQQEHQADYYQPGSLQLSEGQSDPPSLQVEATVPAQSRGRRIILREGAMAGKIVRFSLEVIQHPVRGRPFTELRERRTLHPIGIVTMRCWQCISRLEGMSDMVDQLPSLLEDDLMWDEVEIGVEAIDPSQFICSVTLLHASAVTTPSNASNSPTPESIPTSTPRSLLSPLQTAGFLPANSLPEQSPVSSTSNRRELISDDGRLWKRRRLSASVSPQQTPGLLGIDNHVSASTTVARTRNLHGRVHVNGRKMVVPETADSDGKLRIWFLFPDVSIKYEGRYHLQFRVYRLSSSPSSASVQVGRMGPPSSPSGTLVCEGISDVIEVANNKNGVLPCNNNRLTEYLTR